MSGKDVIEVMLHVPNVIFDHELQCNFIRTDDAWVIHVGLRDARDEPCEKQIVVMPEIDEKAPIRIAVPVRFNPLVLRVARSPEFAVDGREGDTHVVIGGGVDEMPEFLFARPAAGAPIVLGGGFIGEFSEKRKLAFGDLCEEGAQ